MYIPRKLTSQNKVYYKIPQEERRVEAWKFYHKTNGQNFHLFTVYVINKVPIKLEVTAKQFLQDINQGLTIRTRIMKFERKLIKHY